MMARAVAQDSDNGVKQDQHTERISGDERFPRSQRLRSTQDFQRVRRHGRTVHGTYLSLQWARQVSSKPATAAFSAATGEPAQPLQPLQASRPDRLLPTRVGFSVSKRVGDAVTRNLVKRRLREAVRRRLAALVPGWDIVLVARPTAAEADYHQLAAEVDDLLTRARLWVAE